MEKILLIEDNEALRDNTAEILGLANYEVFTAENGKVGVEMAMANPPDLIICDIMMPEMDGYTLIEKIRQDSRINWVPVMFLSAKGQSQDRVKGLDTGADVYMVKPFEPEELVAQVESSLRQAHRLMRGVNRTTEESQRLQVPSNVELTPTELRVVQFVSQGLANREIADKLNVSQRTIESHVSNMLNKTSLHNRTELARWAIESNMA